MSTNIQNLLNLLQQSLLKTVSLAACCVEFLVTVLYTRLAYWLSMHLKFHGLIFCRWRVLTKFALLFLLNALTQGRSLWILFQLSNALNSILNKLKLDLLKDFFYLFNTLLILNWQLTNTVIVKSQNLLDCL